MVIKPQHWRQRPNEETKISRDVASHQKKKKTQERVPASYKQAIHTTTETP